MYEESIIRKTGQWWKLGLAFGGFFVGGILILGGLTVIASNQTAILVVLAGIVFGVASFVYSCSAIRCPSCGARWVWLGISGKSTGQWLNWLLNQSSCPKCHGVSGG